MNAGGDVPRVGIGVPVRNGERYLPEALDSILGQTFGDFEVVISDNASTDRTAEICRDYAARDRRVRVVRNESDAGAAENFSAVFRLARSPYFKWAADDDRIEPTFLERCVAVLDADPTIAVCHTRVRVIGDDGSVLRDDETRLPRGGSPSPHERFGDLIRHDLGCYEVFGLLRSSVLALTPLIARFIASDRALRAELGLRGRYHEIPDPLFLSRDHPGRSTRAMAQHHLRGAWFAPELAGRRVFPHWRILLEYARCIGRVPLDARERALCRLQLLRWLGVPRNLKWLAADLAIAAEPRTWDAFERRRARRARRKVEGEREDSASPFG